MEESSQAVERMRQRLDALGDRVRSAQTSLNAVRRTTEQATAAVKQAAKAARAVATLLSFDEINRLQEASAAASGSKKGSSGKAGTDKTKTALTSEGAAVQLSLPKAVKGSDLQF